MIISSLGDYTQNQIDAMTAAGIINPFTGAIAAVSPAFQGFINDYVVNPLVDLVSGSPNANKQLANVADVVPGAPTADESFVSSWAATQAAVNTGMSNAAASLPSVYEPTTGNPLPAWAWLGLGAVAVFVFYKVIDK